jgi:hypothetical protein
MNQSLSLRRSLGILFLLPTIGLADSVFAATGLPPNPICEVLRPNSNVNTLWDSYNYLNLDLTVLSPSSPSATSHVQPDSGDDNKEQIWGFTDPGESGYDTVTSIYLHIHADDGNVSGDVTVRLKIAGNWTASQADELEDGWYEFLFTGSWDYDDLDTLQLGINPGTVNNTEDIIFDAFYCEICGPENTPTPTATFTSTLTSTPTFTFTATPTNTFTSTPTPTITSTPTVTPTPQICQIIEPASHTNTQWNQDAPHSYDYLHIRKGVTAPTVPNLTDYIWTNTNDSFLVGQQYSFDIPATTDFSSVQTLKVFIYAEELEDNGSLVIVPQFGGWSGLASRQLSSTPQWYEVAFDSCWGIDTLSGGSITLSADLDGVEEVRIYAVYCELCSPEFAPCPTFTPTNTPTPTNTSTPTNSPTQIGQFDDDRQVVASDLNGPISVYSDDIDKDGMNDVAFAEKDGNRVQYSLNDTGSFADPYLVSNSATGVLVVKMNYLDTDLDYDIVAALAGLNEVAWYRNPTGDATPVWSKEPVGSGTPLDAVSLDLKDIDGDFMFDILAANKAGGEVVWFENVLEASPFVKHLVFSDSGSDPIAVFGEDMDDDGDTDVVIGLQDGGVLQWHENDPFGTVSQTPTNIASGLVGLRDVFCADIDGDGDADVLYAAEGSSGSAQDGELGWFEQTGSFFIKHVIDDTLDPVDIYVDDIDGNGDLDLVVASYNSNAGLADILFYENVDGDASVWIPRVLATEDSGAISVHARDLDGDGDLDVVAALYLENIIVWYENESPPPTPLPTPTIPPNPKVILKSKSTSSSQKNLSGGSVTGAVFTGDFTIPGIGNLPSH